VPSLLTLNVTSPLSLSCVPVTIAVAASFNFAGTVVVVVAGLCPSAVTVTAILSFLSAGNLSFGTLIVPFDTVYSPSTSVILTFVPYGYAVVPSLLTLNVTSPLSLSCVPVTIAVAASFNFAGITLSPSVSAGSFVPSVTVTFPVCTVSFSWSFLIVIVPSFTLNVPSIPGTVTTESSG